MKKAMLFAVLIAAALLVSGCEVILVAPGIQPGTPVTINDEDGVTETINPGAAGRYELVVGDEPVRIDVYQETYTPDGDLTVSVADKDNFIYAMTDNRSHFWDPDGATSSATALGIVANPPYSINIPAGFGKAYVMVHNETDNSMTVTVKALTRNTVDRSDFRITGPASGSDSIGYRGAILFLRQHDTYVYDGDDYTNLSFTVPGENYLHLKLKIIGTDTVLDPGGAAVLMNGDGLEVYSDGDTYAGFCDSSSLDGCSDGIDSGEYKIEISR